MEWVCVRCGRPFEAESLVGGFLRWCPPCVEKRQGRVADRVTAEAAVEDAERILTEAGAAAPWLSPSSRAAVRAAERRAATPKTGRRLDPGRPGPDADKTL